MYRKCISQETAALFNAYEHLKCKCSSLSHTPIIQNSFTSIIGCYYYGALKRVRFADVHQRTVLDQSCAELHCFFEKRGDKSRALAIVKAAPIVRLANNSVVFHDVIVGTMCVVTSEPQPCESFLADPTHWCFDYRSCKQYVWP